MEKINIWNLWEREWKNANRFFNSKGNIKTLGKLKYKWYKDFKSMLMMVEEKTRENLKHKKSDNSRKIQSANDLKYSCPDCKGELDIKNVEVINKKAD